ncbi:hypothetical protein OHA88_15585 [Streptomyces sp. NBC_00353]|uniref:hypothetical protein n=1 Tax=Streptomyces sp. NBC_00353 TaxID=2975722 RepID=UPI002E25ECF9
MRSRTGPPATVEQTFGTELLFLFDAGAGRAVVPQECEPPGDPARPLIRACGADVRVAAALLLHDSGHGTDGTRRRMSDGAAAVRPATEGPRRAEWSRSSVGPLTDGWRWMSAPVLN